MISYLESGDVLMFNAPIGSDHAHDVIVKFAFKSRLEATSRCITTVADTLQLGLDLESRVWIRQLAVNEDCHGLSLASAETELIRPMTVVNQWNTKIGSDHG